MKSPPGLPPPGPPPPPREPPVDPPLPPGIWLAVDPSPSEPVEAEVVERLREVVAALVVVGRAVRPVPPVRRLLPAAPAEEETVSPETLEPPPPPPPAAPEVEATIFPPDIEVEASVDAPPPEEPDDEPPPEDPPRDPPLLLPPPPDDTIIVIPPPRPPPPIIVTEPPPRPPRIEGAMSDTYFSAAVEPVSRNVFSIGAAAAVAVRIVTNEAVLVASAFDCHIQ